MDSSAGPGRGPSEGAADAAAAGTASCIACGQPMGPGRLPGLSRCRACGMISADLAIADAELERLYGRD
ncbi:MAG: hypothetical protein JO010_01465, partial [Alphaproteobacteria bacterium]|nr:hypothetical protein [Alphaproteobacteria bacterium]